MKRILLVLVVATSLVAGADASSSRMGEEAVRPFYIEHCSEQEDVVLATVVNRTGQNTYMRFWVTGTLTRLDDSNFFGCDSITSLKLAKQSGLGTKNYATYWLVPGANDIRLQIKDYGTECMISQLFLNGGSSQSQPQMLACPIAQMKESLEPVFAETSLSTAPMLTVTNIMSPISITIQPPLISDPPLFISITNEPPRLAPEPSPTPILLIPSEPSPVFTNLPPMTITNFPPHIANPDPISPIIVQPPFTTFSGEASVSRDSGDKVPNMKVRRKRRRV